MPTPSSESTPTRRKLGSVEIKRRKHGSRYWHNLSVGPSWCECEASVGLALWAAAEQFEALQALARAAEAHCLDLASFEETMQHMPLFRALPESPSHVELKTALEKVRALGALGKEESDAT